MQRRQVLGSLAGIGLGTVGSAPVGASSDSSRGRSPTGANLQSDDGPSATVRWEQTYDRSGSFTLEAGVPTEDGGVVVCGWEARTEPFTGEAILAKIDDSGEIAWEQTVTGDARTYALWDVARTANGYAAIGGRDVQDRSQTREAQGFADGQLIVAFDESGAERWRQVLDSDQWMYSVAGIDDRIVVGRDDEFRQFVGRYEQARTVTIEESPTDDDNEWVTTQPEGTDLGSERFYAACTRIEGYEDDEGRTHVDRREPMILKMVPEPLQIVDTFRYQFDEFHWVSDLVVRDDGIFVAGIRSPREQFIRDPDLSGWLMRIDRNGNRQWYEEIDGENGLRFTGIASHDAWDALIATGQTLDRGRAYLAADDGSSVEQLYEQSDPGLLADVEGTTVGAAVLTGAADGQNDDPFAASIAVDPDSDDVSIVADPEDPAPGDTVTLSVAIDADWSPASVEWGGDASGSGESIETSFDSAGSYGVEATVRNEVGGEVTASRELSVGDADGESSGSGGGGDGIPGFGTTAALLGLGGGLGALGLKHRTSADETDES